MRKRRFLALLASVMLTVGAAFPAAAAAPSEPPGAVSSEQPQEPSAGPADPTAAPAQPAAPSTEPAQASAEPTEAPEPHWFIVDNGGFPRTVGTLSAELSLQNGMEISVTAEDGSPVPQDGIIATGQYVKVTPYGEAQDPLPQRAVVMGDVLGTGKAGIGQLVRMLGALRGTEPLEGIWLAAGDLDGSGEIDITDLAQAAAELVALSAEQQGYVTSGVHPMYLFSTDSSLAVPLYFLGGQADIPYVSCDSALSVLNFCLPAIGCEPATSERSGRTITFRRQDGIAVRFDFEARTIDFPDYLGFFSPVGAAAPDIVSVDRVDETGPRLPIQRAAGSFARRGRPVHISLEDYGIETVWNGAGYIPLQTFSDLFLMPFGVCAVWNGSMAALVAPGDEDNPLGDLTDLYYMAPAAARSAELAAFSYNELCLALDLNYGFREEHGIDSFDTFFRQTGLYRQLTGTDAAAADRALNELALGYLGDVTSQFVAPSHYAGRNANISSAITSSSVINYEKDLEAAQTARRIAFPEGVPSYEEIGNTAFVTIDVLMYDWDLNDAPVTEPPATDADIVSIIRYANEQITRKDSPVENVVLDFSAGADGDTTAVVYALGWLTGTVTVSCNDAMTGAQSSVRYRSDVNLDGEFDAGDTILNLHRCCLVSPACYGTSNAAAAILKGTDVVLMGQQTAGGACVAQTMSVADGSVMIIAGPLQVSVLENGSYYSADKGVTPEYRLASMADFYDREALSARLERIWQLGAENAEGDA